MTDVLLLYAFTRADAILIVAGTLCMFGGIAALILGLNAHVNDDPLPPFFRRLLWSVAIAIGVLIVTPSKEDLAIIVGGKVAIDAARSPGAKEIGGLVLDAIKRQLQEGKRD